MSAALHDNGLNHRDLYICHFLLRLPWEGEPDDLHLHLIDLHRVQIRAATPRRWRVKDLAALYFSSLEIGLTERDLWRFVRHYSGTNLRDGYRGQVAMWRDVVARAQRLQRTRPVVREDMQDA